MKILDFLKKPLVIALLAFIFGLFIGLVVLGWGIWPLQWKDADPSYLNADYAQEYLSMTIDSYQVNSDEQLALKRYQSLKAMGPKAMEDLLTNPGTRDKAVIENFGDIMEASAALFPTDTETDGGGVSPVVKVLIILVILALVGLVGFFLFKYFLPLLHRKPSNTGAVATQMEEDGEPAQMRNYKALGEEPPLAQFMTTYVMGDDLFDDSFSIEAPSGEFLGECGIGISETIGVGDPKKVTAFEVWLFDKNDIQTVTKVVMSEHAYNDPATFQRMEAKGEPILLEPGKQVVLETKALQLVAVVSDMKYAEDALPEKSHLERLTLELAVWPRIVSPA
jgi:hypothetical protein